jgi:hypothetical protein
MNSISFISNDIKVKIFDTASEKEARSSRLVSIESKSLICRSIVDADLIKFAKLCFFRTPIMKTIRCNDFSSTHDVLSKEINYLCYGMASSIHPYRFMGMYERDVEKTNKRKTFWSALLVCSKVSGRIIGRSGFRPGFSSRDNLEIEGSYQALKGDLSEYSIAEIQIDDFIEKDKIIYYPELILSALVACKGALRVEPLLKGESIKRFIILIKNINSEAHFFGTNRIVSRLHFLKSIFTKPLGVILPRKEDVRNIFSYEMSVFGFQSEQLDLTIEKIMRYIEANIFFESDEEESYLVREISDNEFNLEALV